MRGDIIDEQEQQNKRHQELQILLTYILKNQMEIMRRRNSKAKLLGEFLKRFSLLCLPRIFRILL